MTDYRVQFEVFEGPLDLLLHLVKKQEVDIYQVNLTRIATEFVAYLEQMRELDLEVAGEFLVMAATLLYLKSRELLPVDQQVRPAGDDTDEDDPRWELIRRLVEYKKFKDAAAQLQEREAVMDRIYERRPARPDLGPDAALPGRRETMSVFDLVNAVSVILRRFHDRTDVSEIAADPFTVSEKIEVLREMVARRARFPFSELFAAARSRVEVVVTFLALLELVRLKQLVCLQAADFGEIDIEAAPPAEVEATGGPTEGNAPPAPGPAPDPVPESVLPPADLVPPAPVPRPGEAADPSPLATAAGGPEVA